jgi:hypothetical protein
MSKISKNSNIKQNTTRKKRCSQRVNGKIIDKKEGWIIAHIYGEPFDRGFAHGYLLKNELERVLHVLPFIVKEQLEIPFDEYMKKSNQWIKPIVKTDFPEYYRELEGISKGCGMSRITVDFLIAWNAFLTLYSYYKDGQQERCSAFIACGNATENRDIVMCHNTHSDFATGQLLNVVLYITPNTGSPFVMQTSAGFIASTADWFLCATGIIGCETTISNIKYKPEMGTPYFCRIRQAMQYATTFDDFTKIMSDKNAGDYACSWLLGDIRKNEIMLFELGLNVSNMRRTFNGVFYGMNSAIDYSLRTHETTDNDFLDIQTSSGSRNYRLNYLLNDKYYGKITPSIGKKIMSDHYDVYLNKNVLNSRGICKHTELDGEPQNREPYYPYGCTDTKIVNSLMASKLTFLGRIGCGCGRAFHINDFIREHPEYKAWKTVLGNMPRRKWTTIRPLENS